MGRLGRALLRYYSVAVVLLVWEAIARSGLVNPRLFPTLGAIGGELVGLVQSGELWPHLTATLLRVAWGFGTAAGVGIVLGLLMAHSALFRGVFEPFFTATYPIPRVPLYPIFLVAFGIGHLSKVALVLLECLYPITLNTFAGMRSVNHLYIWSAQNMGANPARVFLRVVLPASAPYIFTGLRIALPIAFLLAIVAEFIGATEGMGYLVAYAASSHQRAQVFAGVIVIALVGYTLDRLIALTRDRLVFWERREPALSGRAIWS